jgi:hypothetical protein
MSGADRVDHFGGCPECGRDDGYLNVRSAHALVCDKHRTYWWIGSSLFSSWQHEDVEIWRANAAKLDGYRLVEPLPAGAPVPGARPALRVIQGGRQDATEGRRT